MRGCLGFIVLVVATISLLGFLVIRFVAPGAIAASVRDLPAFRGQPVSVQVEVSASGLLLHRTVDRITIAGENLREDAATIGTADVALTDVSIIDRSFGGLTGTLTALTLDGPGGTTVRIDRVQLVGQSGTFTASGDISPGAATAAVQAALRAAGIGADSVTLGADEIAIVIAGVTIRTRLLLNDSGVVLEAVAPVIGPIPFPTLTVVPASSNQLWRLTSVAVTPTGVRITAEGGARPGS